jgi:hypothetical protein
MRYPVNPGATDSGRGASSDEHATRGRTPGTRVKNQCFTKRTSLLTAFAFPTATRARDRRLAGGDAGKPKR